MINLGRDSQKIVSTFYFLKEDLKSEFISPISFHVGRFILIWSGNSRGAR